MQSVVQTPNPMNTLKRVPGKLFLLVLYPQLGGLGLFSFGF